MAILEAGLRIPDYVAVIGAATWITPMCCGCRDASVLSVGFSIGF